MQGKTTHPNFSGAGRLLLRVSGIVAVAIGVIGSSFGSAWSPQVYAFFSAIDVMTFVDSFMPYFPFVPFYPIFIITAGVFLIVKSR